MLNSRYAIALLFVASSLYVAPQISLADPEIQIPAEGKTAGELRDSNSLGMKFRWCPPGTFQMGCPKEYLPGSKKRYGGSYLPKPVSVTLTHGFWMGQYEVTQSEWGQVMELTLAQLKETSTSPNSPLHAEGTNLPMSYISWNDAREFCKRLTVRERTAGRLPADWEYALPTDAQWEYACRAGTTTATAFGDSLTSTQANFDGKRPYKAGEPGPRLGKPAAVGSYLPNGWKLYDMHGNLAEHTFDFFTRSLPGGSDPVVNKRELQDAQGLGLRRCKRGGFYAQPGYWCTSLWRFGTDPEKRLRSMGFRVALVRTR